MKTTDEHSEDIAQPTSSKLNVDYLKLRRYLGILAITLPLILIAGNGWTVEPSISHYYYTNMTVVFTSVLFAFGLVLIAYKGYPKEDYEIISDNIITNLAGILAIIVAVIPTCGELGMEGVPNWHQSNLYDKIHLISAGLFICLMGLMAFHQFPKEIRRIEKEGLDPLGNEANQIRRRIKIYKLCGVMVWLAVAFLIFVRIFKIEFYSTDTFWGETVALLFYGIAWLTKSTSLGSTTKEEEKLAKVVA